MNIRGRRAAIGAAAIVVIGAASYGGVYWAGAGEREEARARLAELHAAASAEAAAPAQVSTGRLDQNAAADQCRALFEASGEGRKFYGPVTYSDETATQISDDLWALSGKATDKGATNTREGGYSCTATREHGEWAVTLS